MTSLRQVSLTLAFMLATTTLATPARAQSTCASDDECEGKLVCEEGKCVEPKRRAGPAAAAACTDDSDCDKSQSCKGGKCRASSAPPAVKTCEAAEDCADGETCKAGACVAKKKKKAAAVDEEASTDEDASRGSAQRVIGAVVMVVGGVCTLIGLGVTVSADKKDTKLAGEVFAASGAGGGLIGLVIYLTAPKAAPKADAMLSPALKIGPVGIDVGLGSVQLGGTF